MRLLIISILFAALFVDSTIATWEQLQKMHFGGRWWQDSTEDCMIHSWGVGTFIVRFRRSTTITMQMVSALSGAYYTCQVDDGPEVRILHDNEKESFQLFSGLLLDEEHVVRCGRNNEASYGPTKIMGIALDSDGEILQANDPNADDAMLRFEAIGDSITAGFKVTVPVGAQDPATIENQNVFKSYIRYMADAWGTTDYQVIAKSGVSILDYGTTGIVMPREWPCREFWREWQGSCPAEWDFNGWQADLVTINLGTNDFAFGNPTQEQFRQGYFNFLKDIRAKYPNALIACIEPLQHSCNGEQFPRLNNIVNGLEQAVSDMNDPKVIYYETGSTDNPWLVCSQDFMDYTHPTVVGNEKFAARLLEKMTNDVRRFFPNKCGGSGSICTGFRTPSLTPGTLPPSPAPILPTSIPIAPTVVGNLPVCTAKSQDAVSEGQWVTTDEQCSKCTDGYKWWPCDTNPPICNCDTTTKSPNIITSPPSKASVPVTLSPSKAPVPVTLSPSKAPVPVVPSPSKAPNTVTSPPSKAPAQPNFVGTCGNGNVGNGICSGGLCCSEYGYCGSSDEYCTGGGVGEGNPIPAPAPISAPSPLTPTPPVESINDSRMIAFVGNWQSCPTEAQLQHYTHIVISFAVAYTWSPNGNVCNANCQIQEPDICRSAGNKKAKIQQWKNAGKKVILSFGGAGMGGSWLAPSNGCWEGCFGKESAVVSQLTDHVNNLGFDGIDIDYEYFYENKSGFTKGAEAQKFLRDVTDGLHSSLAPGSILTHAPMDSDIVRGTAYYEILKDLADTHLDFLLPQYYNGVTRPHLDGLDGRSSGRVSTLEHYKNLVDDLYNGDATKVVFGFCINDCGGTSSNVDGTQARNIMEDLGNYYQCNGGAFFWVAEDDKIGLWSKEVNYAIQPQAGCSSGGVQPPTYPPTSAPIATTSPSSGVQPSSEPSVSIPNQTASPTAHPSVVTGCPARPQSDLPPGIWATTDVSCEQCADGYEWWPCDFEIPLCECMVERRRHERRRLRTRDIQYGKIDGKEQ